MFVVQIESRKLPRDKAHVQHRQELPKRRITRLWRVRAVEAQRINQPTAFP